MTLWKADHMFTEPRALGEVAGKSQILVYMAAALCGF